VQVAQSTKKAQHAAAVLALKKTDYQPPVTHRVTLAVGHVFVTSEGLQPQAARHHAGQQALEKLRGKR
jgi:double-stranded RNA-binding protein Staufen